MSILRQTHIYSQDPFQVIGIHQLNPDDLRQTFKMHNGRCVTVRPVRYADIPYLHTAIQNSMESLCYWLLFGATHYSIQSAKHWIENGLSWWEKGTGYEFLITEENSREILGGVCLNPIEPFLRHANLGYWVVDGARGQGIASMAALFAAYLGFHRLALERIELVIQTNNQASVAVAKRIGATYEGIARRRLRFNYDYQDAHIFGLIPQDLSD